MAELHIHVDATEISSELAQYLQTLGFWRSDFVEHGEHEGYEPVHHLTVKPPTTSEFREIFDRVIDWIGCNPGCLEGYIEGEVIPLDLDIEEKCFRGDIPIPCKIATATLLPGRFRESEIHITLDRDRSHPELRRRLREIGLFSACLPKSYGIAEVFTVQGSQRDIGVLLPLLRRYLTDAGGGVRCSIKEERVARWWMCRPDIPLPPVVSFISLHPTTGCKGNQNSCGNEVAAP